MNDPHQRLSTLVKRRFYVARWVFIPILLLGVVAAYFATDFLEPFFGYWLIPVFILAVGSPIILAYTERVSCESKNFVYYYTQRGRNKVGFHLRRKRLRRRPSRLDLESESNTELCKGLRTLREAAPAEISIESAHFGDSENLLKLRVLVSQMNPSELTEIRRYKASYCRALPIRLAIHGFRWKEPINSALFLHGKAKATYVSGVRVSYRAPSD